MDSQRIFILVKPDGVERGLVGEILGRIEAKGYKLEDLRYMRAKEEVLRVHYAHLDLAREWGHGNIENLIHASDSEENAEKEISLWFN